jgi:hypothetical protein
LSRAGKIATTEWKPAHKSKKVVILSRAKDL